MSSVDVEGELQLALAGADRKRRKQIKEAEIRSYLKIDLVEPPST